jgi:hypothetical protein
VRGAISNDCPYRNSHYRTVVCSNEQIFGAHQLATKNTVSVRKWNVNHRATSEITIARTTDATTRPGEKWYVAKHRELSNPVAGTFTVLSSTLNVARVVFSSVAGRDLGGCRRIGEEDFRQGATCRFGAALYEAHVVCRRASYWCRLDSVHQKPVCCW